MFQSLATSVTVRPSPITATTALYLCSVTLNSLMGGSVRYQPGHLSGISRNADRRQPGRFRQASTESAHRIGSGTGTRTLNLAVNSRLLYRLSYPGTDLEF